MTHTPGNRRKRIGRWGEAQAEHYLGEKGFTILERNFRAHGGEIDLIALDGKILVFVEVKTKTREGFGEPEDWIDERKQNQIGKVAMGYLMEKGIEESDCRFDVVGITKIGPRIQIHHIEDAFWLDSDMEEEF